MKYFNLSVMKLLFTCFLVIASLHIQAQRLSVQSRSSEALSGSTFARSISDSTLSIEEREDRIFKEIRSGNMPAFYRNLVAVSDSIMIRGTLHSIRYYVLPDFLAIGSDDDYFYCPVRPALAQRIADLFHCSMPTRKMSDLIYKRADVKMIPQPIPPGKAMITVPVFMQHNTLVAEQRKIAMDHYPAGKLVAGNKKDIVISNKIYSPDGKSHVVIYGWHQPGGKAIQPLYNGHDANWADYSHGMRLVQNKIWVDGKRTNIRRILKSADLHVLLSDEGPIEKPRYPLNP